MSASAPPSPADDDVVAGPFPGHYGPWSLTVGDVKGVRTYRYALLACAAATAAGVGLGLSGAAAAAPHAVDAAYFAGVASLGVAFWTIHIYLKPAHTLLKGLWLAGAAGAVALEGATWADGGLMAAAAAHPALLLAFGWTFVGATGLFFKEALCFQRAEAVGLGLALPVLTGAHFVGGVAGGGGVAPWEGPAGAAFAALFVFFAARKVWAQELTADLGDKSVFEHLAREAAAGGGGG